MEFKVKVVSGRILLVVEFDQSRNFWIDGNKATWSPKFKEIEDIYKTLLVIDAGNKNLAERTLSPSTHQVGRD